MSVYDRRSRKRSFLQSGRPTVAAAPLTSLRSSFMAGSSGMKANVSKKTSSRHSPMAAQAKVIYWIDLCCKGRSDVPMEVQYTEKVGSRLTTHPFRLTNAYGKD